MSFSNANYGDAQVKIVDERRSMTNHRDYEKTKGMKTQIYIDTSVVKMPNDTNVDSDDENFISTEEKERIEHMSADEYGKYLAEKNDKSLIKKVMKIGSGIMKTIYQESDNSANASNGRNLSSNSQANSQKQNYSSESKTATLEEIGCKTVRSALQRYGKTEKQKIFGCAEVTVQRMYEEEIRASDLKFCGLTLFDVVEKMGIRWYDLRTKLHLTVADLTRKDGWFDVKTLSKCINCQQGNLILDIGFNIDDIRRLECADGEISQLAIKFEDLLNIGFNKMDLLAFPWFPDSMMIYLDMNLAHLGKSHLNLVLDDFEYLIEHRKGWTREFLLEKLEMGEKQVNKIFSHIERSRLLAQHQKQQNQLTIQKIDYLKRLRNAAILNSLAQNKQQSLFPETQTSFLSRETDPHQQEQQQQQQQRNSSGGSNEKTVVTLEEFVRQKKEEEENLQNSMNLNFGPEIQKKYGKSTIKSNEHFFGKDDFESLENSNDERFVYSNNQQLNTSERSNSNYEYEQNQIQPSTTRLYQQKTNKETQFVHSINDLKLQNGAKEISLSDETIIF